MNWVNSNQAKWNHTVYSRSVSLFHWQWKVPPRCPENCKSDRWDSLLLLIYERAISLSLSFRLQAWSIKPPVCRTPTGFSSPSAVKSLCFRIIPDFICLSERYCSCWIDVEVKSLKYCQAQPLTPTLYCPFLHAVFSVCQADKTVVNPCKWLLWEVPLREYCPAEAMGMTSWSSDTMEVHCQKSLRSEWTK